MDDTNWTYVGEMPEPPDWPEPLPLGFRVVSALWGGVLLGLAWGVVSYGWPIVRRLEAFSSPSALSSASGVWAGLVVLVCGAVLVGVVGAACVSLLLAVSPPVGRRVAQWIGVQWH